MSEYQMEWKMMGQYFMKFEMLCKYYYVDSSLVGCKNSYNSVVKAKTVK